MTTKSTIQKSTHETRTQNTTLYFIDNSIKTHITTRLEQQNMRKTLVLLLLNTRVLTAAAQTTNGTYVWTGNCVADEGEHYRVFLSPRALQSPYICSNSRMLSQTEN